MNEEIQKIIDKNVINFLNNISKKYNLPAAELIEKWKSESDWQNYFSKRKKEIQNSKPDISESELSKMISLEWNKTNDEPSQDLNKLKMKELKEVCEQLNLKKRGNKAQLIKTILEKRQEQKKPSSPILNDKTDHSVEIYISSFNKDTRSSIEDQNEFEFSPDDFGNSDEESLLDEEEDEYEDD
jgi:hypothetical protein